MNNIKIDFISVPFSGHLYPQIELAQSLLSDKKYKIRFITGAQKIKLLDNLGFDARSIFEDKPVDIMEQVANTDHPVRSNPYLLYKQLKRHVAILPQAIEELRLLIKQNQTDIVIADFATVPAGIVCNQLKIPWITTMPTPFALETRNGPPSYLGGWIPGESLFFQVRDFLGWQFIRSFKQALCLSIKEDLKKVNFTLYNDKGEENIYSPYSILGLGMKEFEFKRKWPRQYKLIGPCCGSAEKLLIAIPSGKYKKRVFVTLGTHVVWAKEKLIEDIQNLAKLFKEVLFIISLGNALQASKKPIFKKGNVLVYYYIPYTEFVSKVDAVIHHGGPGILYNCIKYCKPSLILPQDFDQYDFAARLQYHQLGIWINRIDSNKTNKSLHHILYQTDQKKLQEWSKLLKKYTPAQTFKAEVHRILQDLEKI